MAVLSPPPTSSSRLWVFGYGSLVWNPGFRYTNSTLGYVRGYVRRFWQGNSVQRGTAEHPGRVVTLVEESEGITWGRAFELSEDDVASTFTYLDNRETHLGGYRTFIVSFQPKDPSMSAFPVLMYVATPDNKSYLGPAPVKELANQIVSANGVCGYNVEYIIRLADFMRNNLPEVSDEHLYTLEDHVLMKIKEKNLCFATLMGPNYDIERNIMPFGIVQREDNDDNRGGALDEAVGGVAVDEQQRRPREDPSTFLYASRVPPKKLRCLNV